jgi:hypothetical protein
LLTDSSAQINLIERLGTLQPLALYFFLRILRLEFVARRWLFLRFAHIEGDATVMMMMMMEKKKTMTWRKKEEGSRKIDIKSESGDNAFSDRQLFSPTRFGR